MSTQENKKTVFTKKDSSTSQKQQSFFSQIRWGESYISLLLGAFVVIIAAVLGFFYVKMHQPKQELLPPATIARNIKLTISPSEVSPTVVVTKKVLPTITKSPKGEKTKKSTQSASDKGKKKTYIVQKDDSLWSIAEKEYGSGYSWVSIAQANNLANPGLVFSGDTLVIPSVTPIVPHANPVPSLTVTTTQKATPTPSIKPGITTPTVTQSNAITGAQYTVQKDDTLWSIAVRAYGDGYKWVNIAKANNLASPGMIFSGNVLKLPRSQEL